MLNTIAVTMLLLSTSIGFAGEPGGGKEDETSIAETLLVTGTRTERHYRDAPMSVTLISQAQIEAGAAAGTVADLLADVPGVSLTDTSLAGGKRLVIRGDQGTRVLVLIDGQRVSEQKSMDGVPLLLDMGSVQQIEVVKGPASVLYGSEALGGVVNIITKPTSQKFSWSLNSGYNSSTQGNENSVSASAAKGRFSYRVSGSNADHGDRETPEATLEGSGYKNKGASVRLGYSGEAVILGFQYDWFDSDIESYYNLESAQDPYLVRLDLDLPEWSREKLGFYLESSKPRGKLTKYRLDLYSQDTFKDFINDIAYQFGPGPQSTIYARTENTLETQGLLFQTDWLLNDRHYLIAGIDTYTDDLNADEKSELMGFGPFPIVTDYTYKTELKSLAVYLQDEWKLNESITAFLGLRQTRVEGALLSTNNPAVNPESNRDDKLVGSLGLVMRANDTTSLRFNAGQGFRYGTLQQMFIGTSHGSSIPTLPNPDLKPESSENFELGLRHFSDRINLDTAVFYNEAEDYITTILEMGSGAPVRYYANIDQAETYGLEFSLDADAGKWAPYFRGNYLRRAFITAERKTYNTGFPEVTGRLGLKYHTLFSNGTRLDLDAFARGAGDAAEGYSFEGEFQVEEYPSWTTLNLSATYGFGDRYRLAVDMRNLTDKSYVVATESLYSAGRHAVLRFSASFK